MLPNIFEMKNRLMKSMYLFIRRSCLNRIQAALLLSGSVCSFFLRPKIVMAKPVMINI